MCCRSIFSPELFIILSIVHLGSCLRIPLLGIDHSVQAYFPIVFRAVKNKTSLAKIFPLQFWQRGSKARIFSQWATGCFIRSLSRFANAPLKNLVKTGNFCCQLSVYLIVHRYKLVWKPLYTHRSSTWVGVKRENTVGKLTVNCKNVSRMWFKGKDLLITQTLMTYQGVDY